MAITLDGSLGITTPTYGGAVTAEYSVPVTYVYEHIRNDNGAIFYVGKGKEYRSTSKRNRNRYWQNTVAKCGGFKVNYLAKNIDDELAYLCEQERIDQLKRLGINLTNLTVGGEGAGSGKDHHMWGKPHPQKGIKRPWVGKSGADNPMFGKPSPMRGIAKPKGKDSPLFGRKRPEGGGKPSKVIFAVDENGNRFTFASLSEAAKYVGSDRHSIALWCKTKKLSKGYVWEFAV